jgi:hypothetical protein
MALNVDLGRAQAHVSQLYNDFRFIFFKFAASGIAAMVYYPVLGRVF